MEKGYDTEQRVWALLEPILSAGGYELVEVEYTRDRGRWVLRLYIDAEDGVTVGDTTEATRLVDPVLDVEDPIDHAYDLEVSSPGLDRPLRKPEHFARFAGEQVKLRTREAIDVGEEVPRRNFSGVLMGCKEGRVQIDVGGHIHEVPHEAIQRAHVAYRYDEVRR
ncbi:MAG: ribosome maturation factor RimP [Myxococcota bacterium]